MSRNSSIKSNLRETSIFILIQHHEGGTKRIWLTILPWFYTAAVGYATGADRKSIDVAISSTIRVMVKEYAAKEGVDVDTSDSESEATAPQRYAKPKYRREDARLLKLVKPAKMTTILCSVAGRGVTGMRGDRGAER